MELANLFAPEFEGQAATGGHSISPAVLQKIYDHRLFKCFLPASLGGLEMGLTKTLGVIEACAYINGSLGWLIQIGNGGNFFAGYLDEALTHRLFSPATAVLAGSGAANGVAVADSAGVEVTGRWPYCSGADYATFFTFNCRLPDSDGVKAAILFPHQVKVIQDWDTFGLQQTATHTVAVNKVSVAEELMFTLDERKCLLNVSIFDVPFFALARLFFYQVIAGLYRRYLDEAEKIARTLPVSAAPRINFIRKVIDESRDEWFAAQARLSAYGDELDGGSPQRQQALEAELAETVVTLRNRVVARANELFPALGMRILYNDQDANRVFKDLMCAAQHTLVNDFS